MKFHFNFDVKGVSKSDKEGCKKIWEGAHCQIEAEAEISEIIEMAKDKQISFDKILQFVKVDLPKTIRDCGDSLIYIEKQNRILNNELPSKSRKAMVDEIEVLRNRNNELHNNLSQKETEFMDAHTNLLCLREKYDNLNKKYEYLKKKYLEEENIDPKTESWDTL